MIEFGEDYPTRTCPFYRNNRESLPLYVVSRIRGVKYYFKLRLKKQAFWRTYPYSEADGESYYYQLIVINYPLPMNCTFLGACDNRTWREFFRELVDARVIILPHLSNVDHINQVSDEERGIEVAKQELAVMY